MRDATTLNGDQVQPVLPGYRFIEPLGEGGMGQVWLAEQEALGRRVAIKTIHQHVDASPEAIARFEREARSAGSLQSPHVVAIHDVVEASDRLYLVFEFVGGGDLQERIRSGDHDRETFHAWLYQTAIGLQDLNDAGIVHRDIKPQNIFIDAQGRAKVGDLGLVHLVAHGTTTLTAPGTIMGTPHYMAPEQMRGEPVDRRTDIYAWGMTAFCCYTGSPAFSAGTTHQLVAAVLTEDAPAIRSRCPDLSPAHARLIDRCLSKDPANRPQGWPEIIDAWSGTPSSQRHRKRNWSTVLSVVLVCAGGLTTLLFVKAAPADPPSLPTGRDTESLSAARQEPPAQPAWANAYGTDTFGTWCELRVGDTRIRLRWIPPGSFVIGSPPGEAGHTVDEGQRPATISSGFWMSGTEVDQAFWHAVVGNRPSSHLGDDLPVHDVSWHDVQVFLGLLSLHAPSLEARLPTEMEWEYAMRAGATGRWGSGLERAEAGIFGREPNAGPVGVDEAGNPNRWGLTGGHGNVWEWCADGWLESPYPEGSLVDHRADSATARVARGGAWFLPAEACRAGNRNGLDANERMPSLGFRFVIDR